jgi:thiamine kinase-like enzyme
MLHGDLQLYNIIEEQNHIRGIIDWEWTHGGEIDFDLESLIRWALYPHHPAEKELELYVFREQYTNLIQLILEEYREIAVLPHLTQRMTIYQIEYDLHRLTQQSQNTKHPKERLQGWLEEKILGKYLPNT